MAACATATCMYCSIPLAAHKIVSKVYSVAEHINRHDKLVNGICLLAKGSASMLIFLARPGHAINYSGAPGPSPGCLYIIDSMKQYNLHSVAELAVQSGFVAGDDSICSAQAAGQAHTGPHINFLPDNHKAASFNPHATKNTHYTCHKMCLHTQKCRGPQTNYSGLGYCWDMIVFGVKRCEVTT